ncbi:YSIRK-type signal peptide-containing protein [Staphylococcus aureus]
MCTSIRKSTLGVASVIVSTLFLITSQHQAQAAENTNTSDKISENQNNNATTTQPPKDSIKHNLLRNQQTLRKTIVLQAIIAGNSIKKSCIRK